MKTKIIFASLFLLLTSYSYALSAQDDRLNDFSFEDEQMAEPKQPYFALSAGLTGNFLFMNYDDINAKFTQPMELDNFKGPMFMFGFDVFTALSPIINNARLGITYHSGSKSLERTKTYTVRIPATDEIITLSDNYFAELSVQETGVHIDYAFVPFKSLAILPGIGIKWGTMTVEQFTTINPASWDTAKAPYRFSNDPGNKSIQYSFMTAEPQLNIDYALTGFLMLRANVGYSLSFDNPFAKYAWTINGNNEYKDVPSSVNPNGLTVQVGLFLGLFNY